MKLNHTSRLKFVSRKTKTAYSTKSRIVKLRMSQVIQNIENNYCENYVQITS